MMSKQSKNNPLFKHNAETGEQKRPDHPDFWDTSECKKNKLTGIRRNTIVMEWEFWVLGDILKTVSFAEVMNDPQALNKAHVELFHMSPLDDAFRR